MLALTVSQVIDLLNQEHKPDDLLVVTWWSESDTPEHAREGAWDAGLAEEFAGDYGDRVIEFANDLLFMTADAYEDGDE
jgi:hypothetical protein